MSQESNPKQNRTFRKIASSPMIIAVIVTALVALALYALILIEINKRQGMQQVAIPNSRQTPRTDLEKAWQHHEASDKSFAFDFPSGWKLDDEPLDSFVPSFDVPGQTRRFGTGVFDNDGGLNIKDWVGQTDFFDLKQYEDPAAYVAHGIDKPILITNKNGVKLEVYFGGASGGGGLGTALLSMGNKIIALGYSQPNSERKEDDKKEFLKIADTINLQNKYAPDATLPNSYRYFDDEIGYSFASKLLLSRDITERGIGKDGSSYLVFDYKRPDGHFIPDRPIEYGTQCLDLGCIIIDKASADKILNNPSCALAKELKSDSFIVPVFHEDVTICDFIKKDDYVIFYGFGRAFTHEGCSRISGSIMIIGPDKAAFIVNGLVDNVSKDIEKYAEEQIKKDPEADFGGEHFSAFAKDIDKKIINELQNPTQRTKDLFEELATIAKSIEKIK